jgi:hypothetical protein
MKNTDGSSGSNYVQIWLHLHKQTKKLQSFSFSLIEIKENSHFKEINS